ncbi:hypothetical protein BJX68DRAFT_190066 [Aspergillus pseudodeflectus]|uniref:C2H2-type domain-containing protein n=1 Tax=Aspergillus pseudodeflectus TaxID=176178 RepID=A0ABR4JK70_9EURO
MTTVSGEPLGSPNESSNLAQPEALTVRGEAHQPTASEQVRGIISRLTNLLSSKIHVSRLNEVPIYKWNDELGRLRVWAANVGANQTAQSSLEYRLRDDSHILRQVINNLSGLDRLLLDLKEFLEAAGIESTDSDEQDTLYSSYELDKDIQNEAELQEIYGSVANIVSNLYELSIIIRMPSHHDRLLSMNENSSLHIKSWAKRHVLRKYPFLPEFLVERLGTAMSKQKAILQYREKQHNNAGPGRSDHKHLTAPGNISYDDLYETDSYSDESATSPTRSSAFGEGSLKVTEPPKESASRRPFECPYCFYTIVIRDSQDWTRHILHDLMPYVCPYEKCATPDRLFCSRRQWYHHICTDHGVNRSMDNYFTCVVCRRDRIPAGSFERHLGHHLEDLALVMTESRNNQADGDNKDETASMPSSNEPVLQPLPWELDSGYTHPSWSISPSANQDWYSYSSPLELNPSWPSNSYASFVPLSVDPPQFADPGIRSSAGLLGTYGDHYQIQQPYPRSANVFSSPHQNPGSLHEVHVGLEQHLAFGHSSFEPNNSPASRPPGESYTCKWEGCISTIVFRREADLIRHLRTIHISPNQYPCTEPNCNWTFGRRDHLLHHVRRRHTTQPSHTPPPPANTSRGVLYVQMGRLHIYWRLPA